MALRFAVFIKPWKAMAIPEAGKKVRSLGFDLVELPVRAGFACEPATIDRDLPKAVKELAGEGVEVLAITAENALDDERLYAACAEAGVTQNRIMLRTKGMTYFEAEAKARRELDSALALSEQYGVRTAIQNHKGLFIAPSAMGLYHLLKDYDPEVFGAVWDPAHNALEGEEPELALDIIAPYIHFINLKNGYWRRTNSADAKEAEWQVEWTAGKDGRASWSRVARKLKALECEVPLCFSAEYSDEAQLDKLLVDDLAYARTVFVEAGFTVS